MKIFFADLVHTWDKRSVWTLPLNVGFIASYAKKNLNTAELKYDRLKDIKESEVTIDILKKHNLIKKTIVKPPPNCLNSVVIFSDTNQL